MVKLIPGVAIAALVIVVALFFIVPPARSGEPCARPLVLVSWYGKETCQGRPPGHGKGTCHTASGIPFDGTQWLVANQALPMGTMVRFSYKGRSVTAPVEDRGPYVAGRVFDLSHAVAAVLGTLGPGIARVCAEIVR